MAVCGKVTISLGLGLNVAATGRWLFIFVSIWIVAVLVGVPSVTWHFWEWLSAGESAGTTVRNAVLATIGLLALPIAYWRSWVAMSQLETANDSLASEKYHRALELLSSNSSSAARLAGIHRLGHMSMSEPSKYHVEVMGVLCDFIRNAKTHDGSVSAGPDESAKGADRLIGRCPDDVQAAMHRIAHRSEEQMAIEKAERYRINLRAADLRDLSITHGDLAHADLTGANLTDARLDDTNLARVALDASRLCGTSLMRCSLEKASIQMAHMLGAVMGRGRSVRGPCYARPICVRRN